MGCVAVGSLDQPRLVAIAYDMVVVGKGAPIPS